MASMLVLEPRVLCSARSLASFCCKRFMLILQVKVLVCGSVVGFKGPAFVKLKSTKTAFLKTTVCHPTTDKTPK